jgi:hypothetical protein
VTEDRTPAAKKKPPMGQSIGGVLFGFEQQVFRDQPPPHELVHHARPDASVPAGDGTFLTIELPRPDGDGSARDGGGAADAGELTRSGEDEPGPEHGRPEDGRPEVDRVDVPDPDVDPDRRPEPDRAR